MRGLTTAFKKAAAAGVAYPALLAHLDFSGGIVRVWSGAGDLVWGGNTYTGIGDLGGVSTIEESDEVRANGLSFSLNGIPSAMISRILNEHYRGRPCMVWLALFASISATSPIADPALMFSGRMDQCTIEDKGEEASISISAESRLVDLQRPREMRYTDEAQQNLFPGDLGLEFISNFQDKEIIWGSANSTTSAVATGAAAGKVAVERPNSGRGGILP